MMAAAPMKVQLAGLSDFEMLREKLNAAVNQQLEERIASGMSAENVNVLKDRLEGMKVSVMGMLRSGLSAGGYEWNDGSENVDPGSAQPKLSLPPPASDPETQKLEADIAAAVARIATLVNEPPHDLVQDLRDALARQRPAGAAAVGPAPIPCSTDAASLASARARVLATEAALPALRARLDAASSKLTRVLSEVDAQRARPAPGSVERAVAGIMPRAEQSPAGLGLMSPAAGASGGDVAAHGAALRNPVLPF